MMSVDKKTGEVIVTPFSKFRRETIGLDTGSMIIQNYEFSWDNDLRDFIVVEGTKEDRQAYIDSFKDDCGVYNVLKKYALTGDSSLLQRADSFYADISDLPVDQLNPAQVSEKAQDSIVKLNQLLGKELTADELAKMTNDQLAALVKEAVESKTKVEEKVEVKENA